MSEKLDLIVIGGGPGGYVAALRASQLKKKVLLVEEDKLGGTCMNYGCIPTKHLLHQTKIFDGLRHNKNLTGPIGQVNCDWRRVQEEKRGVVAKLVKGIEFLLQRNGIQVVCGSAFLLNDGQVRIRQKDEERIYEAERIILATGSRPSDLPMLQADGDNIVTSREALEFQEPPASLVVVGAGAIGLEMGVLYARLGTKVTVLELMPSILPGGDREMTSRLERLLKARGLSIQTQMAIEEAQARSGRVTLKGVCKKTSQSFVQETEKLLLATGRKPNIEGFQTEGAGPVVSIVNGAVRVNKRLETSVPGVYAIGDLIGGKLLAHKASHEGILAAENAFGSRGEAEDLAIPMAVFTDPEFASVGLTEEEARERLEGVKVGIFSLQANGRALTMGNPEGMVKVVAGKNDEILGSHIIAPGASEWIAELTLAVKNRLKLREISSAVHIHPTLSEAVMEATLKAEGKAIHALN